MFSQKLNKYKKTESLHLYFEKVYNDSRIKMTYCRELPLYIARRLFVTSFVESIP